MTSADPAALIAEAVDKCQTCRHRRNQHYAWASLRRAAECDVRGCRCVGFNGPDRPFHAPTDGERLDWLESIACWTHDKDGELWCDIGFGDFTTSDDPECHLRDAIDAHRAADAARKVKP